VANHDRRSEPGLVGGGMHGHGDLLEAEPARAAALAVARQVEREHAARRVEASQLGHRRLPVAAVVREAVEQDDRRRRVVVAGELTRQPGEP
jgi:hypothetical protein